MAEPTDTNKGMSAVARIRMKKIQDGTLIRDKPKDNTEIKEAP
jgi:hypothetical protein